MSSQPAAAPAPLLSLYTSLDTDISNVLDRAVKRSWQEDHLSYSVCEAISERAPFEFRSARGEDVRVEAELFKNDGVIEELHGDIAVVLSIRREASPDVFGVGFLEAKRRYQDSGRFDKITWKQLEDIEGNTPHAMLLLYDYQFVAFNADLSREAEVLTPVTDPRAVVVPLNLARALQTRTTALYRHCAPLAHQLCYRYLHGLDLDLVGTPSEILQFFPSPNVVPGFVLRMQVSHGLNATPPTVPLPSGFKPVEHVEEAAEAQGRTAVAGREEEPPTATMSASV
jgi:hypothetical protein